jgi:hypothetical protein
MAKFAQQAVMMVMPKLIDTIAPAVIKIQDLSPNLGMDECARIIVVIGFDTIVDYIMPIMCLLAGITESAHRDEDIRNSRENHKFDFDYEQLPAWKVYLLQIEGTKVKQLTETVKDTQAQAEQNQIKELTDLTNDLKTQLSKVGTDQDRKADELKEEHSKQLLTLQTQHHN